MTKAAIKAIEKVLGVEGRYDDNPNDSGGKTAWGITEAVARAYGYRGSMKNLPLKTAVDIYNRRYWHVLRLDEVNEVAGFDLAYELFEQAVNMGQIRAGEHLQRLLNAMNRFGTYWPDLIVDGIVGARTISALKSYAGKRGSEGTEVLIKGLNALQGSFYIRLAETREKDEDFVYGWIKNRL